ncbi:25030_t:CDS:2, partial [Gigaspora margarita]
ETSSINVYETTKENRHDGLVRGCKRKYTFFEAVNWYKCRKARIDIRSEPFSKVPSSFNEIFLNSLKKYKLSKNEEILEMCKKFVENEANNSSVNLDAFSGAEFGEWLDRPEKLQQLTVQMLESLRKIWRSPKYESFMSNGKPQVNEGSYVCEIIAPLLNIVMDDLPGNPAMWGIEGSLASALRKGSLKIARRPDYMTFAKLGTNTGFEIVYLETGRPNSTLAKQLCDHKKLWKINRLSPTISYENLGDVLELYTMHKESGIYKYGLLDRAPIPLRLTSHNNVYFLIHTLLTLRTAVACILFKIVYGSEEVYSDHSTGETSTTVSMPKHR